MDDNIRILVSCHKPTDVLHTEIFQPIQVGAYGKTPLPDMLRDDQGDNISEKNPMYCELTAQYWAWKNLDLDYYGFCHYRRYYNFSNRHFKEDNYGNIPELYLDKSVIRKYAMDDDTIRNVVKAYDIIITERKDISKMPESFSSSKDHYRKARFLHYEDYETVLNIIDELYPKYSKAAHQFADGHISCFCNMYILRKDIFFEYCEWMFAVLEEFCKRTDMKYYNTEALRTPGHLSERLFNIFLLYIEENRKELRIKELQCVYIENTTPQPRYLQPAFKGENIPVVFAANNNFIPMFAACFRSLLDHIDPKSKYDVVLIETDVEKENKETLLRMIEDIENVSLRFYNPGRILKNYKLKANAHISVETYYRFLIQDFFKCYSKVLYLDCDMIICANVADLYHTNIEGYMLAAARDPDFLGQIGGASKETEEYCKTKFLMNDPHNYFQAGVLLFNTSEMRKAHSLHEWLVFASSPYKFNDQDVLNLHCEGHVKYLDMSWNLITDCDHYRVKNVISFAPDYVQKEYAKAHANPRIIHYAGYMKPWHRPTEDYAHIFWSTLRRTEYYEELLSRMAEGIAYWLIKDAAKNGLSQPTEKLHLRMINSIMPQGTVRRRALDMVYSKIF